ncbi:MAG: diguanylate cyclase [Desulfobacteraceae bacterium]|nr:diguanylate cyclase [Desulfobacteraceae bacterium]
MELKSAVIALLIFSGILCLLQACYALKHRNTPAALPFAAAMMIITVYSCGYAFELHNTTLEGIKLALRIEYLGISFIPAVWLILAVIYTGRQKILTPAVYLMLFLIPVTTLILHYTNDMHHLFYKNLEISGGPPFPLAVITKGVWYYVHVINSNLAALIGNFLYILWIIRNKGPYRRQGIAMLAASLAPWAGNTFYQAGLTPYGLDIIPFSLTLSGPVFALALFKYKMLDLSPIARDIIFDGMGDPVIVIDSSFRMVDCNPASIGLILPDGPASIGSDIDSVLGPYPDLIAQVREESGASLKITLTTRGVERSFRSRLTPILRRGRKIGAILTLNDITEHNQLMIKLKELATIDELTGINNRRRFFNLSAVEILKAQRSGRPFSAMMIDLDHFKAVNDTYGHAAGDRVLAAAASALASGLRAGDIFGRYGGEEFTVFLPETLPETAAVIAQRLKERIEDLDIPEGPRSINITVSIGVAGIHSPNGEDLDSVLKLADTALYHAKNSGRNRVETSPGHGLGNQLLY